METSASVWGKTFAATGGTLLFVASFLAWSSSGALSPQEIESAVILNVVTFVPLAVTLIPRIKNRFRGAMILAALVVEVSVGYVVLTSVETQTGIPAGPPVSIFGLLLLFFPVGLILLGGVLVLLSR